ncbi:hypothetical protein LC607_20000 [Nostoc sp. CHAB 5824]|nr:hypothetical protein [Nostoc sp. CHAB 5824]
MRISLFTADAGRSLLIQSGMDSYGEEGWTQDTGRRGLQYSLGFFLIREAAPMQLVQSEKMSVLENLTVKVADKINNLVGLNAVNLKPAIDEVFHVSS